MPNYILLLHDSGTMPPDMSPADIQAVIQRYIAWRQRVERGGRKVTGHKLKDRDGRVLRGAIGAASVTDGPYAEAREVIGGLFILEANDYDEAVQLCQDCPHLDFGTIQVEPTT